MVATAWGSLALAPAGPVARVRRLRIAVVGSGVAGLTAAHVLQKTHDVTLFERDGRLGGHAHTHAVAAGDGRRLALDTGFLVHNERTYPHLLRLFSELGVETQPSDMSFSVRCEGCGLEYAGARGLGGVLAERPGCPAALRADAARGQALPPRRPPRPRRPEGRPADARPFLREGGYSDYFAQHFLLPLTGAIWSCAPPGCTTSRRATCSGSSPTTGCSRCGARRRWRTVVGGSRTYVDAIAARPARRRAWRRPVLQVERRADGVVVRDAGGESRFDRLVLAAHPDQALALLGRPLADEQRLLGAFSYCRNDTVLHTDGSLLPRARSARASWNYLLDACADDAPATST